MASSPSARGFQGELLARQFLEEHGLRYIAANWRCNIGEIDLIMQHGSIRVFVEVRLRRSTTFGEGLETVAFEKQRKLIRTVKLYQQQERYWGDIRFDVVSIVSNEGTEPRITHIPYAFDVSG